MSFAQSSALLVAFVVFGGTAQAQSYKPAPAPMPALPRPVLPMPPMPPTTITTPAPMPTPVPTPIPPGLPTLPFAPQPTNNPLPLAEPPPKRECPGAPGCPSVESEGTLSELAEEVLKELVKCEAEGKSLDSCVNDEPRTLRLYKLPEDQFQPLIQCLGANDLSITKARWSQCLSVVK